MPVLANMPCTTGGQTVLTGTFFCDMTTAQSFPRTPTDVMLGAVIALNAYSDVVLTQVSHLFESTIVEASPQ